MNIKFNDNNKEEIQRKISGLEFIVTQDNTTERTFSHQNNLLNEDGIYVDTITGEPLFSSIDTSLRFIKKDDLEKEGYGEYQSLFK